MDDLLLIVLFVFNVITLISVFVLLINRRIKEQRQKLEEEKYRSLFSKSNDAILIVKNGIISETNDRLLELFNYSEEKLLGEDPRILSPETQPDGANSKDGNWLKRKLALNGEPQLFYWKYSKSNGEQFDAEVSLSGFVYDEDEIVQAIIRDITERTQNETKLRESEEQYRLLFENNPLPMWISERKSLKFVNVNKAAILHYGYSKEEFLSMSLLDIRPKENKVETVDFLSNKSESEATSNMYFSGVWKHVKKDGSIVDVEVSRGKMLVNNVQFNLSIINDITEKKQVERSLKKSEESFRMLAENAADIVFRFELGPHPHFSYVSPVVSDKTGYTPQDFYADPLLILRIIGEEEAATILKIANDFDNERRLVYELQHKPTLAGLTRKDGEKIWIETVVKFIFNERREWIAVEGISRDVTERKQLERELEESELGYKMLFENSPDGVFIHIDGTVIFANPTGLELLGISNLSEIDGKTFFNFLLPEYHVAVKERMARVKEGNIADFEEYEIVNIKGKRFEIEAKSIPIQFRGKPAVQLVVHNLSEKKQVERERLRAQIVEESNVVLHKEVAERIKAQRELQESEKYIKNIINSSLDMIIASDENSLITEFNNAAQITFGFASFEVIGKPVSMLYANNGEYDKVTFQINSIGLFTGEILNKKKSGELFTSFLTASKIFSEEGELIGFVGVSRDVTEVHKAQEKLRQSEELYRDLFENTTELIQSVSSEGKILYVNSAWKEALEYSDQEVNDKNIVAFIHPGSLEHCEKTMKQVFLGEKVESTQFSFVTRTGKVLVVDGNISAKRNKDGQVIASRGIFRDITEQKMAEEKMRLSEERYRSIYDQAFLGIARIDLKGTYIQANQRMCEMLGYTEEELVRKSVFDVSLDEEKGEKQQIFANLVNGSLSNYRGERKYIKKNGDTVFCNITTSVVASANGAPEYVISICEDITEKKKIQEKINEQAAKINAIFDSSSHLIWSVDKNISLTSFNKNYSDALYSMYGVSAQIPDIKDGPKIKFATDEYHEFWDKKYNEAFKGIPQQFETQLIDKNGKLVIREIFLNPIYKNETEIGEISGIAHDITEKKLAEKQMKESLQEKEVLLKEVHHRVKNNLQVISSIINLQSNYIKDKYTLEMMRELQNRIKSMSFIHEALYQTSAFSSINFSEYIITLTQNLIHSYRIYSGLVELKHDVDSILLNLDTSIPCGLIVNELVSNALKYAFPQNRKGEVWVRLKETPTAILLTVSDNGVGLPENFDFRNSDSLGLQLVTSLVEQINGEIFCENKIGTKFTVTFKSGIIKKTSDVKN
ncbi:MAG: PAS domain S-box protein [Bacteroidetes bacterium]|nr:PAS domain S-box protein [Bacteroidota bacterium]